MIGEASRRKIPIAIINGRISDKAFPRYSLLQLLCKPVMRDINLFCMQSDIDAVRIAALGADQKAVRVVGNIKFDRVITLGKETVPALPLAVNECLIVAGSTHEGEEEILLTVFRQLREQHPGIRLLIAPRHPHRAGEIKRMVQAQGLPVCLISEMKAGERLCDGQSVFILDIMGVLKQFYARADIVFVGGSLVPHGGQNPIEPADCGKPILFGRYMFNFTEIAALFLAQEAALRVKDQQELATALDRLLRDAHARDQLAARAKKLVQDNRGSVERIMAVLREENFFKAMPQDG
jgi:3-deoxy-D-manno-octulosonic-acid transferase